MATKDSNDRPTLDYATPPSREQSMRDARSETKATAAGLCGAAAGLLGGLMLFVGVQGIVWLARDRRRVDSGDVFQVVMFNAIGGVCVYAAFRWIRYALRNPGRPRLP